MFHGSNAPTTSHTGSVQFEMVEKEYLNKGKLDKRLHFQITFSSMVFISMFILGRWQGSMGWRNQALQTIFQQIGDGRIWTHDRSIKRIAP